MSEAENNPDKLDEPEVEGPSLEERLQRLEEILSRLEQDEVACLGGHHGGDARAIHAGQGAQLD